MDICTAELTQWMEPWADIGTGVSASLILFFVLNAITLSWRLRRPEKMSFEQSIAARNMVYYLLVNAAIFVSSNSCSLPQMFKNLQFIGIYLTLLGRSHDLAFN